MERSAFKLSTVSVSVDVTLITLPCVRWGIELGDETRNYIKTEKRVTITPLRVKLRCVRLLRAKRPRREAISGETAR